MYKCSAINICVMLRKDHWMIVKLNRTKPNIFKIVMEDSIINCLLSRCTSRVRIQCRQLQNN